MSRVVLIGGCGFIGHHLAQRLSRLHEVAIIDSLMINNLYAGHDGMYGEFLKQRLAILDNLGIPLLRMDARDYHAMSHALAALNPDVIVHLAAVAHVSVSQKSPFTTFDHSLRTLENALDVSCEIGVKRFVYFSSSTVYGDWTHEKMHESDHCNPIGVYGSLKLAGELMVKAYRQAKGLNYTIIRPSALYGPRCVSGRVIQKFIEAAAKGESLRANTEALDFTHIDDLIEGVHLAIANDVAIDETFNLTYGEAAQVDAVAQIVVDRYGAKVTRDNEAPLSQRGALDIAKAKKLLGYKPLIDIHKGVDAYIDWYMRFNGH